MLIGLALVKALVTCLCLATGWKGGYVFPIMFVGVALGLAVDLVFPGIPLAVAVAATLGGALVATFQAPLSYSLFTLVMVQAERRRSSRSRWSSVPPVDAARSRRASAVAQRTQPAARRTMRVIRIAPVVQARG
jgi:hypothetical protein